MKVQGVETRRVEVEITQDECMKMMYEIAGLHKVAHSGRESYWERQGDKLLHMCDTSYHGSPHYEAVEEITDPVLIKRYDLLVEFERSLHVSSESEE